MEQSEVLRRTLFRSVLVFAFLALSGCALLQPEAPPPAVPATAEPEPAPEPAPPVEKPRAVEPEPAVDIPLTPQPVSARVAIVIADSLPAYADVAGKLTKYLEAYAIYNLADPNQSPRQVFSTIAETEAELVVAIGLRAARFAKTFATVPVVFSQVFNVREHGLISESTRGIAVLPPLDLQLDAWREMDPTIRDIGAIVGDGHEELIAEAERAMSERGIRLHHAIANSDRETLYHFRRLIRGIDGYLLFPDNRILSRRVFSEIMTEAARHHVQVAVFNESLLKHGATFSASAVDTDIADTITIVLNEIENGNLAGVVPITPLSEIRIRTNPAMVRVFGLIVDSPEIDNPVADAQ